MVRDAAKALRDRGLTVWLDEDELVAGVPWITAIEQALEDSAAVAVMIGTSGIGPWERPEMHAALIRSVDHKVPVIPLLLPGAPENVELPLILRSLTWVDCRAGFTDDALDRVRKSVALGRQMIGQDESAIHEPVVRPSVSDKTKISVTHVWSFLADRKSGRSWLVKACLLLPVLLVLLGLAPPWEVGVGWTRTLPLIFLSLVVEAIAFVSVFIFVDRWTNISRVTKGSIALCLAATTIYLIAFFSLTEPRPETSYRIFSGLKYSEEFVQILEFRNNDSETAKLDFEYDPLRIYVPWTVSVSRLIVILSWLAFLGFFAFYLGVVGRSKTVAESRDDWSDDSLVALELPTRVRRLLYDSHLETIGDLCALNQRQLEQYTRMNAEQISKVTAALAQVGICLRRDP